MSVPDGQKKPGNTEIGLGCFSVRQRHDNRNISFFRKL
jgi:hypothetical protein